MKRILIADASKASLVMTSEVFKDHFPGVQVVVARTSADAIELSKTSGELDAFIIDYDLPDRDGAYTAARLKKMHQHPILITAFDRPDVHESIDRDLAAFDDCLSWLKKPVKPELVVSLAQRFIEGKHRCQRRLACSIPAFLEIEFNPSALQAVAAGSTKTLQVSRAKAVSKTASKKAPVTRTVSGKPAKKIAAKKVDNTKKSKPSLTNKTPTSQVVSSKTQSSKPAVKNKLQPKAAAQPVRKPDAKKAQNQQKAVAPQKPAAPLKPIRKMISVMIDDVSLGGAKLRINNKDLMHAWTIKGKPVVQMLDLNEGQVLQVHVPPSNLVEAGSDALEKWKKSRAKELNVSSGLSVGLDAGKAGKSTTMSPLAGRTKTALAKTEAEIPAVTEAQSSPAVLKGEIRWVAASEMFTFCGLRSETVNVSKRLFESMIEIEARSKNHLSPMVSPNTPRGSKLNA